MRHDLTITQKGIGTETASGSIATFETDISRKIPSLSADIMPVQDLNGYEQPWPGGGGKNLLNANQGAGSVSGVTFTNNGGVITVSGTASANVYRMCGSFYADSGVQYTLNGCPSGGANGKFRMTMAGFGYDYGSGYTFTGDGAQHNVSIDIYPAAGNVNLTFKPMITLASETDPTFEPYSNICPITGWTGVNVTRVGKNLLDVSSYVLKEWNTDTEYTNRSRGEHAISIPIGTTVTFSTSDEFLAKYTYAVLQMDTDFPGSLSTIHGDSSWRFTKVTTITTVAKYIGVNVKRIDNGAIDLADLKTMQIQVEIGSIATDYEPYQGETYEIDFSTSAGTVYGGTVDVAKGKLVVDTELVTISGSYTWASNTQNGFTLYNFLPSAMATYAGVCNWLPILDSLSSTTPNIRIGSNNKHLYTGGIIGNIPGVTDAASWKAYLTENPMQVTRPLAEPLEYDLTPEEISTLVGQNNIWADTGDITVQYPKLIEAIEHKLTIREAAN